jgi:hypothetical protein
LRIKHTPVLSVLNSSNRRRIGGNSMTLASHSCPFHPASIPRTWQPIRIRFAACAVARDRRPQNRARPTSAGSAMSWWRRRTGRFDQVHRQVCRVEIRRSESAHELHPELALLLSTTGSTGSRKLVRLSADNLQTNATPSAMSAPAARGSASAQPLGATLPP